MVGGRPTSSKAPSTILAFSSWRFIVEDRLTPVVRVESKERKSGDWHFIETSLCHSETIGGTAGKSSEVVEEAIRGSGVLSLVCSARKRGELESLILVAEHYRGLLGQRVIVHVDSTCCV